jgi:hypothetical protein
MRRSLIPVLVFLIFIAIRLTNHSTLVLDRANADLTTAIISVTTITITTSTSFTTTTTTYSLTLLTPVTTSTTTSVTSTYTSTSLESITLPTTATVQSTSWLSETISTTVLVTQTSTAFSPTVTIPLTRLTVISTTIYSPIATLTSTESTGITVTTTSTSHGTTVIYSPTVTVTSTRTETTTALPGSFRQCIIASAAYGSELAEPVQSLREFRDQKVRSTFAGIEFVKAFETFYYSFSPAVASIVASSEPIAALVRLFLYPLVSIFQASSTVFHVFSFSTEAGIILSGIIGCASLGIAYLTLPLYAIQYSLRKNRINRPLKAPPTGVS